MPSTSKVSVSCQFETAICEMSNTATPKRQSGDKYEDEAIAFLTQQGLTLVTRNYQCKLGEIDLIVLDDGTAEGTDVETIVFVEVRYRKNSRFGGAAISVTPAKQRKISLAALHYLQSKKSDNAVCRFDVLAFSDTDTQWIKDAFHSPL